MQDFEVLADPSHLLLAACLVVATYFQYRSMKPPNPPPSRDKQVKDVMGLGKIVGTPWFLTLCNAACTAAGLLHAAFTVFRPRRPSTFCPAPGNLVRGQFEWTPLTMVCIALLMTGGALRMVAYVQLGPNFTYQLAKPSGLVTGGLYRYMQHPSYTGIALGVFGVYLGVAAPGAGLGCFAPAFLTPYLPMLHTAFLAALSGMMAFFLPVRIKCEEDMLHQTFGKEWEDYHQATSRLFPGIY